MITTNYTSTIDDYHNGLFIELPYFIGDYVKTYDTGRLIFRGQVVAYTITNNEIIVHVSEHNTHKTYGFLLSEIQLDNDFDSDEGITSNE